jgi:predicted transcriptional regulator YheO
MKSQKAITLIQEHLDWRVTFSNVARGLGEMFAPSCEVVFHDLTHPETAVLAIYNPLSGRKVGDPATAMGWARVYDIDFPEIVQNYENKFPDGRRCRSTSIGIKNTQGEYVGALCLNLDISYLSQVHQMLGQWLSLQASPLVEVYQKNNGLQDITAFVNDYAQRHNLNVHHLNLAQRRILVQEISQQGLLAYKNAHVHLAKCLGVSRASIYNDLIKSPKV